MVLAPFNVSYSAGSPSFSYIPQRDGDVTTTWNASFTASTVWPAAGADPASGNGFPYRRTQASSASVSFTFIGSALYLCVTPNGAKYTFQVDQTLISESSTASGSDPACSNVGAQTTLVAEGLDASQSHTAILTVNAAPANEFHFLGGQATLGVTSAGQTLGPNVTVDDQAPNWNMFPGRGANQWDSHTGLTGHFNNSETFSCLYNPDQPQTATLPFSGAGGVVLYGGIRIAHEFYTITFNGKSYPVDASSQWQEPHLVLFAQGGLDPNAQYSISVSNFNPQHRECNPNGGVWPCCVTIDGVVLLAPGPPDPDTGTSGSGPGSSVSSDPSSGKSTELPSGASPSAPTTQSSPIGAIVGGVLGGIAGALLVIGLVAFFLFRRRRQPPVDDERVHTQFLGAPPVTMSSAPRQAALPAYFQDSSHEPSMPQSRAAASTQYFGRSSYMPTEIPRMPDVPSSVGSNWTDARSGASASDRKVASATPSASVHTGSAVTGGNVSQLSPQTASSRPTGQLAPEDLERVLQFVAQRMDPTMDGSETLPGYHA